ncbi:MAG: HIT domain-containing protein [Christensenellales bacterium]|jgi:histidine triad (HIT) family protein
MDHCIFCSIAQKKMEASILLENEDVIAIKDIQPQAPVHVLIIPKKHYADILAVHDEALTGAIIAAAQEVAKLCRIDESGFRIVVNTGADGRQTVGHLHFHVLGGAKLSAKMA